MVVLRNRIAKLFAATHINFFLFHTGRCSGQIYQRRFIHYDVGDMSGSTYLTSQSRDTDSGTTDKLNYVLFNPIISFFHSF